MIVPYEKRILSSLVGNKQAAKPRNKHTRSIFKLTNLIESVLVGLLLSDA